MSGISALDPVSAGTAVRTGRAAGATEKFDINRYKPDAQTGTEPSNKMASGFDLGSLGMNVAKEALTAAGTSLTAAARSGSTAGVDPALSKLGSVVGSLFNGPTKSAMQQMLTEARAAIASGDATKIEAVGTKLKQLGATLSGGSVDPSTQKTSSGYPRGGVPRDIPKLAPVTRSASAS